MTPGFRHTDGRGVVPDSCPDPLDPFGGVSVADVRASLEHEADSGRGPDCPARPEQPMAELRELIRLAEHWEANPAKRPYGYTPDPEALLAGRQALAEIVREEAKAVKPAKDRRVPGRAMAGEFMLEGVGG